MSNMVCDRKIENCVKSMQEDIFEKAVWRIATNQELKKLHGTTHLIEDFKGKGLSGWSM
jgi:hypothetical protein